MKFPRVRQESCLASYSSLIELEAAVEVLRNRVMVAAELRNLEEIVI